MLIDFEENMKLGLKIFRDKLKLDNLLIEI